MKGLILKDLYNLRKYSIMVFVILAFNGMLMFMMDSVHFLCSFITLMLAATAFNSFAYDIQCKWDEYALSMPITKKDIVKSKYILALLFILFGTVLSIFIGLLRNIFKQTNNIADTLTASYTIFVIAALFVCLLLPLVYKFGFERSRVIIIAIMGIPIAAVLVIIQTGVQIALDEKLIHTLLGFSPLLLIVSILLSFVVSYTVYRNKEV